MLLILSESAVPPVAFVDVLYVWRGAQRKATAFLIDAVRAGRRERVAALINAGAAVNVKVKVWRLACVGCGTAV